MNYEELKKLYSRDTLNNLSGIPKKFYKLNLTLLTFEMLKNFKSKRADKVYDQLSKCYLIRSSPLEYKKENEFSDFKKHKLDQIKSFIPKEKTYEKFIDSVIELTRNILDHLSMNQKKLLRVSELEKIFNVRNYLRSYTRNSEEINLEPHVWIDLDLDIGLTPTYPDLLTYGDLINLWGMYLDKIKLESDYPNNTYQSKDSYLRQLHYEITTLRKYLNISAITFVEAYLYHVFYDIKESVYSLRTEDAKKFVNNNTIVEDEQIIKQLIIPEFCSDNTENKNIIETFQKYRDFNQKRNRYIHTSSFEQNGKSHLIPILETSHNKTVEGLNTCIEMVLLVECLLPNELKQLFWWDYFTHPNFESETKGSIITR